MLRQALSVLPTWPVIVLVPCLVILVMGFYYIDRYQTCSAQADFRQDFMRAMQNASDSPSGKINFIKVTDFPWDTLQVFTSYKHNPNQQSCPFNWDWSAEEIKTLIDQDNLVVLVFTAKGSIIKYLELDGSRISFSQAKQRYLSNEARFTVLEDKLTRALVVR